MLAKLNSRLFATAATVAALTIGISVAQPAEKASAQVGAGSSAAGNLYSGFGADYRPIGSGAGINEFRAGNVEFAGTDIPVATEAGEVLVPVAGLTIAAPINPGVGVSGLSQDQVCAIFRREITNYSEVGGPDLPITIVVRTDNSGTKFIVNQTCGATVDQPGDGVIGVPNTGGVISAVSSTPGAIGYTEDANLAGLPSATDARFIGPTYALVREGYESTAVGELLNRIFAEPGRVSELGYSPL
ncbi:PstS family phosphate ABC transporter substrate-binding protein [Iningainema tapete]|uniref:PstS family phosphate ABC transporter substrate-binding protein n=1 Tax=Iningainema tapete BLCC-T55 TaxID=2748662 RepID=A0A8J7C6L4_9CYAN|nr:substrate-binding domain-containing protein [Iningainema tapete]MBD2774479.1 PstS family phosphate ABC transporter substrate-binding protein [Iningainema tapete BLCC-T55]